MRASSGSRLGSAPAVRAALIQLLAAVPMLAIVAALTRAQIPLTLYGAALLQGVLAAGLTYLWRFAGWWTLIQLVFPIALVCVEKLHLPPALLLGSFLFLLLLFWSTFRTQVPFYPSGAAAWQAVAALLPPEPAVRLIDIGSGLGGLVIDLARRRRGSVCTGIELAPLPWLLSVARARLTGSTARFMRGDYERLDFANYDVVFAYLSPAAMSALWRKAKREMRPATMLISYEFGIAERVPDQTVTTASGHEVHVWRF